MGETVSIRAQVTSLIKIKEHLFFQKNNNFFFKMKLLVLLFLIRETVKVSSE